MADVEHEGTRRSSGRRRVLGVLVAVAVLSAGAVAVRRFDVIRVLFPRDCALDEPAPAVGPNPTVKVTFRRDDVVVDTEYDIRTRAHAFRFDIAGGGDGIRERVLQVRDANLVEVPPERRHLAEGRSWVRYPDKQTDRSWTPFVIFPRPERYAEVAKREGFQIVCAGREDLRGMRVAHYEVRRSGDRDVAVRDDRRKTAHYDVWLDASGRPRRIHAVEMSRKESSSIGDVLKELLHGRLPASNADTRRSTVKTMDFDAYGEPERITLPPDDDVLSVASLGEALQVLGT